MNSNPYEMKAFDRAYLLKRKLQDERDWFMGQYVLSAFGTVLSGALSKNSNVKYIEKPMFQNMSDVTQDPEANERLAVAEMEKYIAVLKQQGNLPETIMTDIRKDKA